MNDAAVSSAPREEDRLRRWVRRLVPWCIVLASVGGAAAQTTAKKKAAKPTTTQLQEQIDALRVLIVELEQKLLEQSARLEEPALTLVPAFPYAAPVEDLRLKK